MRVVRIGAAAVVVSALLLAGCSSSDGTGSGDGGDAGGGEIDGTGRTVELLLQASVLDPEGQKGFLDDVAKAFKEETGAEVKFTLYSNSQEQNTILQTAIVSGVGPDVVASSMSYVTAAYASGAYVKLSDEQWDQLGGKDNFNTPAVAFGSPSGDGKDGVLVPWYNTPYTIAYNTRLFKEAGIDNPGKTWDEVTANAKKLTKDGVYGLAVPYADPFTIWKIAYGMTVNAGNPVVDDGVVTIDDETTFNAYNAIFDWITADGVVDPAAIGWASAQAVGAFAEGKAAMVPMASPGSALEFRKGVAKDEFDYAVQPNIAPGLTKLPADGNPMTTIVAGYGFLFPDYSENLDLALALVKMLSQDEWQVANYKITGSVPYTYSGAEAVDDPLLASFIEAQNTADATPFTGAWAEIQAQLVDITNQALPMLAEGKNDPKVLQGLLAQAQEVSQTAEDRASR